MSATIDAPFYAPPAPAPRPIRVAIVENDPSVMERLTILVREAEGLSFAGAFRNAESALLEIPHLKPDVVLMDVGEFTDSLPAGPSSNAFEQLSPREKEVLNKLAQGLLVKEIAVQLNVGFGTVRTYIRRIYEKLHVQSRAQATAYYYHRQTSPVDAASLI